MDAGVSEQGDFAVKCAESLASDVTRPSRKGGLLMMLNLQEKPLRISELAVPKPTQVGGYQRTKARE